MPKGHLILYIKETKLVLKGCIQYLVLVDNSSVAVPSLLSVAIVKEITQAFPTDLCGVPP